MKVQLSSYVMIVSKRALKPITQFKGEELEKVEAVAMDMWEPFIAATKKYIPNAGKKIVFDRFHAMQHMLNAVDKTRRLEHKKLLEAGDHTLKGTKYIWLWNKENVPEWKKEDYYALKSLDLKIRKVHEKLFQKVVFLGFTFENRAGKIGCRNDKVTYRQYSNLRKASNY